MRAIAREAELGAGAPHRLTRVREDAGEIAPWDARQRGVAMVAHHVRKIAAVNPRRLDLDQHLVLAGRRRRRLDQLEMREIAGALEAQRFHFRYFFAAAANAS